MSEIDDLIKILKDKGVWKELNLTNKEFKEALTISLNDEAKSLVADCFRNNPKIEQLHDYDKISQEDMKTIMKHAVNRMYYWLWLKENYKFIYDMHLKTNHLIYTNKWDVPEIDIDVEE